MNLPNDVRLLLDRLENAGFACYAVGGCVRDACLGRIPKDYDLCSAATPDQVKALFCDFPLVLAGEKHGTVGVVTSSGVVEITTFRTDGDYADNRHPDKVRFVSRIEEDLARRDFTINAMAWSPSRGFADPFGGQEDLGRKRLRAVGDPTARFQEDSLRILRGVRFAARFSLEPEPTTLDAMIQQAPLMEHLARERVFDELCKLLPHITAQDLLRYSPIITQVIPELVDAVGFDQHNPHHKYDIYTHTAHVVAQITPQLPLRWAALLHDVGKAATFSLDASGRGHFYGHAQVGAEVADGILRRLKAPNALREDVVFLIRHHMTPLEPDKKLLRRRISRFGMERTAMLLELQMADFDSKGTGNPETSTALTDTQALLLQLQQEDACLTIRDLAVNGHDLMALGITGVRLGLALQQLLDLVLEEQLPNEASALLQWARKHIPM